jgi:hypothetical protein
MVAKSIDQVIGVDLEKTTAVADFALGTTVKLEEGGEAIYVQASGALTGEGYVALIDKDFQAALIDTTLSATAFGLRVGVAQVAFADNAYGWLVTKGETQLRVNASAAANVALNTTATAGQLDDDGTAGAEIVTGAILTVARGGTAGLAQGYLTGTTVGATIAGG